MPFMYPLTFDAEIEAILAGLEGKGLLNARQIHRVAVSNVAHSQSISNNLLGQNFRLKEADGTIQFSLERPPVLPECEDTYKIVARFVSDAVKNTLTVSATDIEYAAQARVAIASSEAIHRAGEFAKSRIEALAA